MFHETGLWCELTHTLRDLKLTDQSVSIQERQAGTFSGATPQRFRADEEYMCLLVPGAGACLCANMTWFCSFQQFSH